MTSKPDTNGPDDALAAEYALGVLPHAERVAFEARLASDNQLREKVRFWDERLVALSDDIAPVTPPSQILVDIEKRLYGTTQKSSSLWGSLGFWRGLAVASLAGVIVLGGLYANSQWTPDVSAPQLVSEIAGEDSGVRVVAFYQADELTLKIRRTAGEAPAGRDFELWLIAGDNPPVSLGVLPETESVSITVPENLVASLSGGVLAISDEPDGGSPTGQPTGAVLATGQVLPL